MFHCSNIPYKQTNKFSKIVLDYLTQTPELRSFYTHEVTMEGIENAIQSRQQFQTDRQLLADQLLLQYQEVSPNSKVLAHIQKLKSDNTFTICTAHQPNIFTGHLYFIYKILHVIKLADRFKTDLPQYDFVPVFFMGSEDADLEELNHIVIDGKKYTWETKQTGAVGRMKIDEQFIKLISEIEGSLVVQPHGKQMIELVKKCYQKGFTIERATFLFVNELFGDFGLIVFLPDAPAWKKPMASVFEDDLFHHNPGKIAAATSVRLEKHYKAQAFPREINLFYLKGDVRNRIEKVNNGFLVHNTDIVFTREELQQELTDFPERFSPNVILRGLFQETVLPNIAFVGGGGELAYWLQLKDIFEHYSTPYPVLILRNSFLIVQERWEKMLCKLELTVENLFKSEKEVFENYVKTHSENTWELAPEKLEIKRLYSQIVSKTNHTDTGLERHIRALETQTLNRLNLLEKKLLKAQKRKFEAAERQIAKLYRHLFPNGGLQERTENFMGLYSVFGPQLLRDIYHYSLLLEQEFTILREQE